MALGVVAASLAAIGMLMGTTMRGARSLGSHLALVETTRLIWNNLPTREQPNAQQFGGTVSGYQWRANVLPFVAPYVDPRKPTLWLPQTVVPTDRAPDGTIEQIDTVRLQRRKVTK